MYENVLMKYIFWGGLCTPVSGLEISWLLLFSIQKASAMPTISSSLVILFLPSISNRYRSNILSAFAIYPLDIQRIYARFECIHLIIVSGMDMSMDLMTLTWNGNAIEWHNWNEKQESVCFLG